MKDINKKYIFLDQELKSKEEVLNFLSNITVENKLAQKKEEVLQAYKFRESQISTGLEDGFAIPHAKSSIILEPAVLFIQLKNEIEWETFDNSKVKYVISFLIPENGGEDYLQKLSIISSNLAVTEKRNELKECKNVHEVFKVLKSFFEKTENKTKIELKSDKYILGIASCPAGLAHTYMAKKAMEDACYNLGYKCKVEAHGSLGVENQMTEEEIENALFLIKAIDVEIDDYNRFENIFVYTCTTNSFIKNKEKELEKAIDQYKTSKFYKGEISNVEFKTKKIETKSKIVYEKNKFKSFGNDLLKHLMTGIGFCIPLLIGTGFMIGISQLLALISVENSVENFPKLFPGTLDNREWVDGVSGWNGFLYTMYFFGMNIGLGYLFLTMLGGFICYSMNGKAGLAPGFIAGFCAIVRNTGFIGVILTSLTVGYIIKLVIAYMIPKGRLRPLGSVVIVPLIGVLSAISLGWWVYGFPLEWLNVSLQNGLKSLATEKSSLMLLCVLIAAMMAFDLGGPVNKSALAVYTFLWADVNNSEVLRYVPNGAGNIAIAVPALGIAVATWLAPNYFTSDEKTKANTSFMTGIFGISEGAIPFLIKHPLRSILINVTGAMIAVIPFVAINGQMTVGAGVIYGWVFTNYPIVYILSIALGAIWVGIGQAFFQKLYFHKKTETKFMNFVSKEFFANQWIGISNIFRKKENKKAKLEDKFNRFMLEKKFDINKIENY